jgi:hypothetical protein
MEIGAGHFARLEFATDSEIPIPFIKEITALARAAVRRARNLDSTRPASRAAGASNDCVAPLSATQTMDIATDEIDPHAGDTGRDVSCSRHLLMLEVRFDLLCLFCLGLLLKFLRFRFRARELEYLASCCWSGRYNDGLLCSMIDRSFIVI